MSRKVNINIECENCKKIYSIPFYASINPKVTPDIAKRFLNGDFSKAACPSCNHSNTVFEPVLYHDMKKELWIHVLALPLKSMSNEVFSEVTKNAVKRLFSGARAHSKMLGYENVKSYKYDIAYGIEDLKDGLIKADSGGSKKMKKLTENVHSAINESEDKIKNEDKKTAKGESKVKNKYISIAWFLFYLVAGTYFIVTSGWLLPVKIFIFIALVLILKSVAFSKK